MPRSGETATGAALRGAAGAVAAGAVATDAAAGRGAAAITSSFLIRPPTPVPFTLERSTPFSDANFLTIGVI